MGARKMEVLRTRLCEWQPVGIDALALAPRTVDGIAVPEPRLAVGRTNGTVELWDTTTWHLHSSSDGHAKRSVRGFVWVSPDEAGGPWRLISAGLHREVTEWDLAALQPRVSLPSSGGPVWALTASGSKLYAACEDGTLRVFSLEGGPGNIAYERKIGVGSTRLLSLACYGSNFIFTGGSQSRITKWSLASGSCEASMKVEQAGSVETLVWALASLGDHGVASGDSLGLVTIWDAEACVVRHRFSQHQADILALSTTMDGAVLLAGGIDAKISTYFHQPDADERWVFRNAEFGHTHDIRAIAADGVASEMRPYISGGVSGALRVHPLRTTTGSLPAKPKLARPIECSGFSPMLQTASVAQGSRLLVCQRNTNLELWYLQKPKKDKAAADDEHAVPLPEAQLVLRVSLGGAKEGRHISASAIAPDGRLIAASDLAGTRLFHLNLEELEVHREKGLPQEVQGVAARALAFCGKSFLALASWEGNEVVVADCARLKVAARFTEHRAAVTHLASCSNHWLASADAEGGVHVFNLDSLQHHARVPIGSEGGFPTALAFSSDGRRLYVVLSSHAVVVFDVESQALATDVQSLVQIPPKVVPAHVRVCGVAAPAGTPGKIILWGHSFLTKLELGPPSGVDGAGPEVSSPRKKKKKRRSVGKVEEGAESSCSWYSYEHMQHILACCSLDEAEWGSPVLKCPGDTKAAEEGKKRKRREASGAQTMVLTLEVSPDAVESALPQPFERKRFAQTTKK